MNKQASNVANTGVHIDDTKCGKCSNKAEADHICPFQQDINDDITTLCNCCVECHNECCRDI